MKSLTTMSCLALFNFSTYSFAFEKFSATCFRENENIDPVFVDVVDEREGITAYVTNETSHHILPCSYNSADELICGMYTGDPTKGGGCTNPYSIYELKKDKNGFITYHERVSGFVFFDFNYTCNSV